MREPRTFPGTVTTPVARPAPLRQAVYDVLIELIVGAYSSRASI